MKEPQHKNFEEWWKESKGEQEESSPQVEALIKNIKKLCQQAFEAGQKCKKK